MHASGASLPMEPSGSLAVLAIGTISSSSVSVVYPDACTPVIHSNPLLPRLHLLFTLAVCWVLSRHEMLHQTP